MEEFFASLFKGGKTGSDGTASNNGGTSTGASQQGGM
jgi:hypothetical protein